MATPRTETISRSVIGNWKMNPRTEKEAIALFKALVKTVPEKSKLVRILLVPAVYYAVLRAIKQKTITLGVQNIHHEQDGAHTGDIALSMFAKQPAYIMCGHSERRALGETDQEVNKKVLLTLKAKSSVVLCVGEKERDHGILFFGVIRDQLEKALNQVSRKDISSITIAYEPVWAIGKHAARAATADEVREVVIFIKKALVDLFGPSVLSEVKIIYGASVDSKDAKNLIQEGGVDGLLLGRASLDAKEYARICDACTY
jgi:triosephosphate isomerase